ncbi:MAG: TIGR00366 family protein [Eubacteriales bacterium]|nr:TIGR00366 family protein [Eubacteriales bacterium]
MIKKMTNFLVIGVKKYLPSPYVLALLLSLITFVSGWLFTEAGFMDMTKYFGDGLYSLLAFTMQMVLVLVTGHVLASSKVVVSILQKLAKLPKNKVQAVMFTAFVSYICSYINWGFGLIAGALIAKEIATVNYGSKIHYPLIIAAAYSGNIARGPSSSIPLAIATKGHIVEEVVGIIPVSQTLFSSWNIIITLALLIAIPFLFKAMTPNDEDSIEIKIDRDEVKEVKKVLNKKDMTFSERLDNSMVLAYIIGGLGLIYLVSYFMKSASFDLNLNIVIMIFLVLGIFAQKTPGNYVKAMQNAVKTTAGITLQFMFYAGIMGMMRGSGLTVMLSEWFISISTIKTFPLFTFWSAGLVNIFVPSGGGQWAVQGPIAMTAGASLGVDPAKVNMALAWGDSWTNQIQPFWALPALAIAGLDVGDIMGYCAMVLLMSGVIISLGFFFL